MAEVQKSMTLQPEYIENYIKDLLANIYNVDPDNGEVTGIASESPLYGKPVTDADGNPVEGEPAQVEDPTARYDMNEIFALIQKQNHNLLSENTFEARLFFLRKLNLMLSWGRGRII